MLYLRPKCFPLGVYSFKTEIRKLKAPHGTKSGITPAAIDVRGIVSRAEQEHPTLLH